MFTEKNAPALAVYATLHHTERGLRVEHMLVDFGTEENLEYALLHYRDIPGMGGLLVPTSAEDAARRYEVEAFGRFPLARLFPVRYEHDGEVVDKMYDAVPAKGARRKMAVRLDEENHDLPFLDCVDATAACVGREKAIADLEKIANKMAKTGWAPVFDIALRHLKGEPLDDEKTQDLLYATWVSVFRVPRVTREVALQILWEGYKGEAWLAEVELEPLATGFDLTDWETDPLITWGRIVSQLFACVWYPL